jgi:hypothetical protein
MTPPPRAPAGQPQWPTRRPTLAGAASLALRDVIDGPPVQWRTALLAPGRLVLRTDDRVLLLDVRSTDRTLPCTVVVPRLAALTARAPRVRTATVGAGTVRIADLVVRPARWWVPPRVPAGSGIGLAPGPALGRVTGFSVAQIEPLTARLTAAARHLFAGRGEPAADALCAVLGLGPGSTPAADDAIAGVLLAARAGGADPVVVEAAGRVVAAAAPGRTTALSAELLRHAMTGSAAAVAVAAVQTAAPAARAALLTLGATSGSATALGIDLVRRLGARRVAA